MTWQEVAQRAGQDYTEYNGRLKYKLGSSPTIWSLMGRLHGMTPYGSDRSSDLFILQDDCGSVIRVAVDCPSLHLIRSK